MNDLNVAHIKKLWILDLTIQLGSLKQAALTAKITPSAVSQTISSLEKSMGKTLLIRDKGKVVATEDALSVIDIVRPAFEAFDRLQQINSTPIPKVSWISFGTYESIGIDVIPPLIHVLRRKLPNLRLSVRISRTSNLVTMLRKGELCTALLTEIDGLDKFYTQDVFMDRLGLYVSRIHSINSEGWDAVEKYGVGSLSPGRDGLPRYFQRFLRQYNITKPLILSDSFETIRSAAAAGVIVGLLPHRVACRNEDLIEIHPRDYNSKKYKETGSHRILIAAPMNCDREETDFITNETRLILSRNQTQAV